VQEEEGVIGGGGGCLCEADLFVQPSHQRTKRQSNTHDLENHIGLLISSRSRNKLIKSRFPMMLPKV
jgi:hypothetical protein